MSTVNKPDGSTPTLSCEDKLAKFLRQLEDPKTLFAKSLTSASKTWAYTDFDPQQLVSAVTNEIALDRLLPAAFARGDAYQHLAVGIGPPGCENVDAEEWEDPFRPSMEVNYEDIGDIPDEIRMCHPDFESALDECVDNVLRDRVTTAQRRKNERQQEWKRDNLKGRVVSLLREWLRVSRTTTTLESRAAENLALELFSKVICCVNPEEEGEKAESALKITTSQDLHEFLLCQLGNGDHLESVRTSVVNVLVPLMIGWVLIQDLRVYIEGPRDVKLPGLLEVCERRGHDHDSDCWWSNDGHERLLDVLPPSGSVVTTVALASIVQTMAVYPQESENTEMNAVEALLQHCDFQNVLDVKLALPAIKAMLLRWKTDKYDTRGGYQIEDIAIFLDDVQDEYYADCEEVTSKATPEKKSQNKPEKNSEYKIDVKIAFSCRCEACSQLVSFLENVQDRDQRDEDTRDLRLSDSKLRFCLYDSVEKQGSGFVTAALCGGGVRLRRGRESKNERCRKRKKIEAAAKIQRDIREAEAKVLKEKRAIQYASLVEKQTLECTTVVLSNDLKTDLQECLLLVADN